VWLPGVFFVLFGGWMAVSPIGAARFASSLRFTGLSDDPPGGRVRTWRAAGALMAVVGLVLIAASL
jgi:hypothetical protein